MTNTIYYQLGKRDALLELLMVARERGVEQAFNDAVHAVATAAPENCHVQHFLKADKTKNHGGD